MTLAAWIGAAAMLLVSFFAFLKGGRPERRGAGAYLFAWFASLLLQQSLHDPLDLQWGILAIDSALAVVFAAMVWKSRRAWPVWACALQVMLVASHVMLIFKLRPPISAYYTVVNMAGYGILAAIALGTFWTWQERRALRGPSGIGGYS